MYERETIQQQQELLAVHRRTLNVYLKQQAAIGQAYSPPALVNGILETRSRIRHIKACLQADGIAISDEPDDDEQPLPVVVALGPPRPVRHTALWLLIGALALGMVGLALGFRSRSPSQSSVSDPTATPLYAYSFSDGDVTTWTGNAQDWQIVQDGGQTVYEADAPLDRTTASNPRNITGFEDLGDYAVETRLRINHLSVKQGNAQDVWLSMRAQSDTSSCGESYNFYLSIADQHALLARNRTDACPIKALAQAPISFKLNEWHTLRAEVQGAQLRLLIDGNSILASSDTNLRQGFFYITVGAGARVQFSDLKVYALNP